MVRQALLQPRLMRGGNSTSPSQTTAYEVATIKPPPPGGFATLLRVYIQAAYGIPVNSAGWVIGPDWINSTEYVIQGKVPESIRAAMQTMTPDESSKETRLMQQSLLAERFKLKAHFEAKEMPVYQLVVANSGSKLKENHDVARGQAAIGRLAIRGTNVPVHVLSDMLENVPEIGGRVVLDKTKLSGNYDFSLKWASMDAAALSAGSAGTATQSDVEGVSLFTAIEEQLGLKLVFSKVPGQVLVIDHIERPTQN